MSDRLDGATHRSADFLLELRSEEIPARMQVKAKDDLARLFAEEIAKAGLTAESIETFATPRRLSLIARGLPNETEDVRMETKGPKVGAPQQALDGFMGRYGLTMDQLVERDGVYFAERLAAGRPTAWVLRDAIPAIIRAFPWPKSMRWGAGSTSTESLRWVRPLQGIVALFGDDVVACDVDGIVSGRDTTGHRFHHSGPVTITNADDYIDKLRAAHVIVHLSERRRLIEDGAAKAAAAAGLTVIPDDGLIIENAGLTEWPVPLLGRFDPAFLDVPREVIQLTMRTNQKYFACADADGRLTNAFVCTANIDASDGGAAVIAGNEKVLSARLSDAKFFWEADLKVPLEAQAEKLKDIVFHEKLGTVADKVERVAKLARWLCEEGIVKGDANLAEQAARLCKADLVTGMVGEFPELQGIMGGYYARAQGLPDAVADAIRDHYALAAFGPVEISIALADRIDTTKSFFNIGERPTGSRDPFAIRRAGLGIIYYVLQKELRLDLRALVGDEAFDFLIDRWKVQNREAGGRPDLIDAVVAASMDGDLSRLGLRMRALQAFVTTDEGKDLLAGYKRAANILKKDAPKEAVIPADAGISGGLSAAPDTRRMPASAGMTNSPGMTNPLSCTPEIAETALIDALDRAEPLATAAIEREDFEGAMSALASLRAPIDAFFETVTVNDPDPDKRAARLALLARVRDAVHRVADFSKIDG